MTRKKLKEKKKLRIINGIRTLTTRYRFKKRFPNSKYNRKTQSYKTISFKEFKERKQIKTIKRKPTIPIRRFRKQIALNFINRDASDSGLIFISLRAITINPEITERGLKFSILEAKKKIESEFGITFNEYNSSYTGVENEEISIKEDTKLNDLKVHIEFFSGGKVTKTFTR